jgi:hypothetical protein
MEAVFMSSENEVDKYNVHKYLSEQELYQIAKKRVAIKKDFFIHFGVYIVVNGGLFALNAITTSFLWSLFPIIGWGIGLGCHYVNTVITLKLDYKDSAVEKEMEFLKKSLSRDK